MSLTFLRYMILLVGSASIAPLTSPVNAAPAGHRYEPVRIAVLGDSLVTGFGLAAEDAFPAQLERALRDRGVHAEVINHGMSGDTSAGGLRRVDWMLQDRPHVVLVELGANDALRGLKPERMEANLDAVLSSLLGAGVVPVLAGMRAPRNLGTAYTESFDGVFPRLASRHGVSLYPFFLEGVAGVAELNLRDGLHPNPAGVARTVRGVLPLIEAAVRTVQAESQ